MIDYYGIGTWYEGKITHLVDTGYKILYEESGGVQEVDSPKMRPLIKGHVSGTQIKEENFDEGDISPLALESDEEYGGEGPFFSKLTSFKTSLEEKKYKEAIEKQDKRIEEEKKIFWERRKKKKIAMKKREEAKKKAPGPMTEKQKKQALKEFLAKHKIKKKNPTWNFYEKDVKNKDCQLIKYHLEKTHKLTALYLVHTKITDKGAHLVAKALKTNSTLTALRMDENKVGDGACQTLGKLIADNTRLKLLGLIQNKIGCNGAWGLAQGLNVNSSIESLYLDQNKIGKVGGEALAKMLCKNRTLTEITLNVNHIGGDPAIEAFGLALRDNTVLKKLDLEFNPLEQKARQWLQKVADKHSLIKDFWIGNK